MKIDFNYGSIEVKVDLKDKICVFFDMSGTGKTFLFTMLKSYFLDTGISFISVDYTNYKILDSYDFSDDINVIILDNADLYMNEKLFSNLDASEKLVVMSIKDIGNLNQKNMGFYRVIYKDTLLKVKRLGENE